MGIWGFAGDERGISILDFERFGGLGHRRLVGRRCWVGWRCAPGLRCGSAQPVGSSPLGPWSAPPRTREGIFLFIFVMLSIFIKFVCVYQKQSSRRKFCKSGHK
jgi:hypothetical protein